MGGRPDKPAYVILFCVVHGGLQVTREDEIYASVLGGVGLDDNVYVCFSYFGVRHCCFSALVGLKLFW